MNYHNEQAERILRNSQKESPFEHRRRRILNDKKYVKFVDIVRKYQKEMPFPEAVEKAINECIKKGILILAEFLRKNRAEVLRVSIFEYDEEKHMRLEREESRQEGFEEGEERINDLYDKLHELNREEDIWKAIKDVEYRKKLLEEFHLD